MKKMFAATVACAMLIGVAWAGEIKSGLPVGTRVPAFNVRDVTGPHKGETLCYRCQYGARPVACVFAREATAEVIDLAKKIDEVVGKNKDSKMAAFVVVVTEDADAAEKALASAAKDKKITDTPLTVIEGATGPSNYKLSKDADVTVMMWVESEVKVNHAFGKKELDAKAIDAIVGETKKILE